MTISAHRSEGNERETSHATTSRTDRTDGAALLVGFFGVVAAVNAVMIKFAVTTFAGTETDSAYRAGLAYKGEEAAAAAQAALNWSVDGRFVRSAPDEAILTVDVKDSRQAKVDRHRSLRTARPSAELAARSKHCPAHRFRAARFAASPMRSPGNGR